MKCVVLRMFEFVNPYFLLLIFNHSLVSYFQKIVLDFDLQIVYNSWLDHQFLQKPFHFCMIKQIPRWHASYQ